MMIMCFLRTYFIIHIVPSSWHTEGRDMFEGKE